MAKYWNKDDSLVKNIVYPVVCAYCGGLFQPKKNKNKGQAYKFCCIECSRKDQYGKRVRYLKVCIGCGKRFSVRSRLKNQKYCTRKCFLFHTSKDATTITKSKRFNILKRDGFSCQYCGRSVKKHGVVLHVDHIVPVSIGGRCNIENLTTACEDCNLGKSDRVLKPAQISII